jgi:dolichol-phosphate mannosyltransferase
MAPAPALSVVVPTRNEAENVEALWDRLSAALTGVDAEVCIVDDSDDGTPERLTRLAGASGGRLRCQLRQGPERQGGLSTAVVAGLHMARGRFVCVMDADLQHPPERIPAMLNAAEEGADLVVASRYVGGGSASGLAGTGRRLVSRGAGALARLLFSEARRSTDPLSGFFLCRRAVLDGIEFRPVGFKILLELLVCVPGLRVVDVPLEFQARAAGSSKASMKQGFLYLRHLRSLVLEVEGSARFWKFGLVGLSGLIIFLALLVVLSGPAGLPPLVAFLPAYAASFVWNAALNRVWTFADQRRTGTERGPGHHLLRSLISGVVMYGAFAGLIAAGLAPLAAGALGAAAGMAVNGVISRRSVRDAPSAWARLATDAGVQAGLAHLAGGGGADRAFLLPPRGTAETAAVPHEVLESVLRRRRAVLWTEAASHRPQRRSNIAMDSLLLVPMVRGDELLAVVVCERHAAKPFGEGDLERAMHAASGLTGIVIEAGVDSITRTAMLASAQDPG